MSGGSFDHNLAGIVEGQGAKWDDTAHELIPADFAEYLHELLDVTGTASPAKGVLLVGDGTTWQILPVDTDGKRLALNSAVPLGVEWVEAASGGGSSLTVEDDGSVVASGIDTLDFGENLVVTDLGGGEVLIDAASGGGETLRGTAEITDPDTETTVSVSFPRPPSRGEIQVTPSQSVGSWLTSACSKFSVKDLSSIEFTIEVDAAPGASGTVSFDWLWVPADSAGLVAPDDLPGLVGWWKADTITGLSDADPVSSWPDSSPSGVALAQGAASDQPMWRAVGPNGEPYVSFDGSNDNLFRSRLLNDDIFTMFAVVRAPLQTNKAIVAQHPNLANTGRTIFLNVNGDKLQVFFNNGSSHSASTTETVFDNTWNIVQVASDGAGNTGLRVNDGVDDGTITGETWIPYDTAFAVGAIRGTGTGSFYTGDVAELIVYNQHHSDVDRTDIVNYLAAKYGITV